jgi:hypothetical protein
MGLPAMLLAQTLVSLAPTMENVRLLPVGQAYTAPRLATGAGLVIPDTARRRAISLSDGYYTRLDIHRYVGYAMLPLFLVEYVAGQKLLTRGSAAPLWAEKVHKPAAYAVAGVFTINTVTGLLNLVEAGKIPEGRKRRLVHSALMLAADVGLIYGIAVAPSTAKIDARIASGKVGGWTPHKIATVSSMGVATIGYLMMYLTRPD